MYKDPIVEEIRKYREEYAASFNYDLQAIFADLKKRQIASGHKFVRLPIVRKQPTMNHSLLQRITLDDNICYGKPCIRGLRYPVELILELLSSGMTFEEILADYDDLERDDIVAALLFATQLTQVKSVYKLA